MNAKISPGAAGEIPGLIQVRLIFKLEKVSVLVHGGAGPGWHDDGEVPSKDTHGVACHLACVGEITPVERRLTTAGLVFREMDAAIQVLEDFHRRPGHIGEEGVAQASRHQEDFPGGGSWGRKITHWGVGKKGTGPSASSRGAGRGNVSADEKDGDTGRMWSGIL